MKRALGILAWALRQLAAATRPLRGTSSETEARTAGAAARGRRAPGRHLVERRVRRGEQLRANPRGGRREPRAGASPGDPALRRSRRHRFLPDVRPARRDQPLRASPWSAAWPGVCLTATPRASPSCWPPRSSWPPACSSCPRWPARPVPTSMDKSRRRRHRRTGVLCLREVAHPLLPDPHAGSVRHLLPRRRRHLHHPLRLSSDPGKPWQRPRGGVVGVGLAVWAVCT